MTKDAARIELLLRGRVPDAQDQHGILNPSRQSLAVDFSDDSSFLRRITKTVPVIGSPLSISVPDGAKGFSIIANDNEVIYAVDENPTDGVSLDVEYVGWRISSATYPKEGEKHILPTGTSRTIRVGQKNGGGATTATINYF